MSTLAHVFEAAGISTVALGTIGEHVKGVAPPRGLFCDFPLGRPLGKPNDADFQHRVLAHAFGLLRSDGPVVEQFGESIKDDNNEQVACTLPPLFDPDLHPAIDEAKGLRPAYDRAVAKYGNRTGAFREIGADDVPAAIQCFIDIGNGTPWKEAGIPGAPNRVCQDIRGYYEMAALELAEHAPSAWAGSRWYHEQTETGRTIVAARSRMAADDAPQNIWFYLTPGDIPT